MPRPWQRPPSSSHTQLFGRADGGTRHNRPVILYVDLHDVPDILDLLRCPEAYQLTSTNISNLSDEEEFALLTYMNFYRHEDLDKSISIVMEDVIEHINRTWNATLSKTALRFSIQNQAGDHQDLRNFESLRDILWTHRPWWHTEQDFGTDPRVRFRDSTSPFFLRLTCHRAPLPAPRS